jgi:hypothetical protein
MVVRTPEEEAARLAERERRSAEKAQKTLARLALAPAPPPAPPKASKPFPACYANEEAVRRLAEPAPPPPVAPECSQEVERFDWRDLAETLVLVALGAALVYLFPVAKALFVSLLR